MSDEENDVKFTEKEKRDEFKPILKERKTFAMQEAKTYTMSPKVKRIHEDLM